MSDTNNAEELDPEVLGDTPTSRGLPGIEGYPPERPLGVEDPSILEGGSGTPDDLTIRTWRQEPEVGDQADQNDGYRLDPGAGNRIDADDEARAIASSAQPTTSPAAEEAALTIADAERGSAGSGDQ